MTAAHFAHFGLSRPEPPRRVSFHRAWRTPPLPPLVEEGEEQPQERVQSAALGHARQFCRTRLERADKRVDAERVMNGTRYRRRTGRWRRAPRRGGAAGGPRRPGARWAVIRHDRHARAVIVPFPGEPACERYDLGPAPVDAADRHVETRPRTSPLRPVPTLARMIETERLFMRPLSLADVDAFVDLHADPRVNRFVGSHSRERAREKLGAVERQWEERGHGLCAVELKATGEFIGRSGLQYWTQYDEVELGWTFRAEHWGHGYATEAARAWLDWGFATLDAAYFTALIRPGNEPSVRVAERLGFSPRRQDTLAGAPVAVYAVDRPTAPRGV